MQAMRLLLTGNAVAPVKREATEKIPCPCCGYRYSRVLESRNGRRRRECESCGERFATVEVLARSRKPARRPPPHVQFKLVS